VKKKSKSSIFALSQDRRVLTAMVLCDSSQLIPKTHRHGYMLHFVPALSSRFA